MSNKAALGSQKMQSFNLPRHRVWVAEPGSSKRAKRVLTDHADDLTGSGKPLKAFELGVSVIRFLL